MWAGEGGTMLAYSLAFSLPETICCLGNVLFVQLVKIQISEKIITRKKEKNKDTALLR